MKKGATAIRNDKRAAKVPRNFRLSQPARDFLFALAHRRGISETATLEMLIRETAQKEKISLSMAEAISEAFDRP